MSEYTKEIGWRYAEVGMSVELRNDNHATVVGAVEHTQISLLGDGGNTARVNGARYAVADGWLMYVKPAPTLPPEPAPGTTYVAMGTGFPITRGIGNLHFRSGWDEYSSGGKTWAEVVAWHQEGIDDPEDDMVGPFVVEELMTESQWEANRERLELPEIPPYTTYSRNYAYLQGWNDAGAYLSGHPKGADDE